MNWFSHAIFLCLSAGLAFGAAALVMLAFDATWPGSDPTLIIASALVLALSLPLGLGIASRWLVPGGQPLTGWLTSIVVSVFVALAASLAL